MKTHTSAESFRHTTKGLFFYKKKIPIVPTKENGEEKNHNVFTYLYERLWTRNFKRRMLYLFPVCVLIVLILFIIRKYVMNWTCLTITNRMKRANTNEDFP